MRLLTEQDFNLLEYLCHSTQSQLLKTLPVFLEKVGYKNVIKTKDYIIAEGNIPVALVNHLDTVANYPPDELYYDRQKGVLWALDGPAGFDDRAGIFITIKILQSKLRPYIIFTVDEELGGLGAQILSKIPRPKNIKYLLELDRQGVNQCVFYDCGNEDFKEYIRSFGLVEYKGSYSDISFLMKPWNVCGVNLGCGFLNEHTPSEILMVEGVYNTVKIVKDILSDENIPEFEYKEETYYSQQNFFAEKCAYENEEDDLYDTIVCEKCKKHYFKYEIIPIKGIKPTDKIMNLCPHCIDKMDINWCDICGFAYEVKNIEDDICLCPQCLEENT